MDNYEKKYKEALEKAQEAVDKGIVTQNFVNDIFPELKESEDEMIRNHLISLFEKFVTLGVANECETSEIKIDNILSWLKKQGNLIVELQKTYVEIGRLVKENCYLKEKQGEQKSVEWSGVDNAIVEGICLALEYSNESGEVIEKYENWLFSIKDRILPKSIQKWSKFDDQMLEAVLYDGENAFGERHKEWIKSLKDRVQPQEKQECSEKDEKISKAIIKYINGESDCLNVDLSSAICWIKNVKDRVLPKQEWSKDDETFLNTIISDLDYSKSIHNKAKCNFIDKEIKWIKSLKERYTWKPSNEQMDALYTYIYNPQYFNSQDPRMELVESVYQDLKKLREE